MRSDLGDFQTPLSLVAMVLDRLDSLGIRGSRVLEPTCGKGHFVSGLFERLNPPQEVIGFDLQPQYLDEARHSVSEHSRSKVTLTERDFFEVSLKNLTWKTGGPLLIVGNPPWVTTAKLGRLGGSNRPERVSMDGVVGLDAKTGRSNFDLAEAVWIKLLTQLTEPEATIALLCKTASARNVLRWAVRTSRPLHSASIHRIDARRWFGAATDACLFIVKTGNKAILDRAEVFPSLTSDIPETMIGVVDGLLVADMEAFQRASTAFGHCPMTWRQGVKHDASDVMELTETDGTLVNGYGEAVNVEREHVFPLLKGADLAQRLSHVPNRYVIVTQRSLGEDTSTLACRAPRLWAYLNQHSGVLSARKSKVYASRPQFSMFGIGDYTFAQYKVAIPGLHKGSPFRSIGPRIQQPVLLDDTCYFLPCINQREADRITSLLNGLEAQALIDSLRFRDAKRSITKSILQRIDFDRLEIQSRQLPLVTPCGLV